MTHTHTKTFTYTARILQEINNERRRQVVDLGYDAQHDDEHGVALLYGTGQVCFTEGLRENNREELIYGLAVLVATVEAYDRQRADTDDPTGPPIPQPADQPSVGYCPNCQHAIQLHRHRGAPLLGKCDAYGCSCPGPIAAART